GRRGPSGGSVKERRHGSRRLPGRRWGRADRGRPAALRRISGCWLDDALPGSDGTQAADAPRVAEQLAFDAEPFLAVFVDDEPRPTLAECGIHVRVPQIEWLEDVPVSVDHVVRPRHRESLRGQVYFAAAGNAGSLPM